MGRKPVLSQAAKAELWRYQGVSSPQISTRYERSMPTCTRVCRKEQIKCF